jgi:hypothetical protein
VEVRDATCSATSGVDNGRIVGDRICDRAAVERAWDREVERGSAPKEVAEVVYRAATATAPKVRYPVGEARKVSLLRRLVPAAMFAQSIRKQFGLIREAL